MSNRKSVIIRHRGDGRAIRRDVEDVGTPPSLLVDFKTIESRMFTVSARNPKNGPFRVEHYNSTSAKSKYSFKVVNVHGYRVHRGGPQSCHDVCENLNTEYAKYLLLKE